MVTKETQVEAKHKTELFASFVDDATHQLHLATRYSSNTGDTAALTGIGYALLALAIAIKEKETGGIARLG